MEAAGQSALKSDFKLKSKPRNGEILQLHHTVRGTGGEPRRIRFTSATFQDATERLACADHVGNIFILDFSRLQFWKLGEVGSCSALHFAPDRLNALLVATINATFDVSFLNVETGKIEESLAGHTSPVKHICFSSTVTGNLLTSSPNEAIIWELTNYSKYFTLRTYKDSLIQQIMFAPVTDNIVVCFTNDTVQLWNHQTMKPIKKIIPSDMKHMKCIAVTANGRAMVIAGLTPTMILFSLDTWSAIKTIDLTKFHMSGAREVAFIPQVFDGGSNRILAVLGSDCTMRIFDLEDLVLLHSISPESSLIKRIVVSPNGKYFACILKMGEVNIFNSAKVIEISSSKEVLVSQSKEGNELRKIFSGHKHYNSIEKEEEMKACLDGARLRRILSEYSEYPEQSRSFIWRALLNTPRNKNAYISLVNKPIHSSYKDIEKQFTLHSAVTLKNLKRLLSCLAHWCPLFGVMRFLPGFVFPFVRVLQKDPLLLFESVATIMINYCQLWFEYAPFPPINILAMVENVLGEHDRPLLEHFCKYGISNQVYALKILETSFSEVLTCPEWLIVWDHILSNEPAFMLMAVVAYNIVQRNAIKKMTTVDQFENFYHMQNPFDKKSFLKKCYTLLDSTSEDIHPRRYLNAFTPMEKGLVYPQFTGYPKATIHLKLTEEKRKKTMKNKMSLKELTARNQEKQLEERYGQSGVSSCSEEDYFTDDELGSGDEDRDSKISSKSDNGKEEVIPLLKDKSHGDQSVEKVTSLEFVKEENTKPSSNESRKLEKMAGRQSSGNKYYKKKCSQSEDLERVVEKFMKKLSQPDM